MMRKAMLVVLAAFVTLPLEIGILSLCIYLG
jgi:hypothetical protein